MNKKHAAEAEAITKQLRGSVWFVARTECHDGVMGTVYFIYRRKMGLIAKRRSPDGLMRFLRSQLPAKSNHETPQR